MALSCSGAAIGHLHHPVARMGKLNFAAKNDLPRRGLKLPAGGVPAEAGIATAEVAPLCKALDFVVGGETRRAADILAQRG